MKSTTCIHGLVQQKKFGTDVRDGLTYCRGCRLPTADSLLKRQVANAQAGAVDEADPNDLQELIRLTESQSQALDGIRVGIFLLLAFQVVLVALVVFGAIRVEVVVFR